MNQKKISQEYEKAIQYIYELMKSGELTIGSRLPTERALAETLGIGRNSTREALSIMHGMGLIERRQGSGNYMELLKLLFEVRFRRDYGIIWCAYALFIASQNMNLVCHYPWFTT